MINAQAWKRWFSCVYIAKEGESYHTVGCGLKRTSQTSRSKYIKGDEAMHEMRKTGDTWRLKSVRCFRSFDGAMDVFSYLFYFMNCGIAQGIMEEAVQKAADVTPKLQGLKSMMKSASDEKNKNCAHWNAISREEKNNRWRHLFMAEVSSVRVYRQHRLEVSAKIKTRSAVVAGDFFKVCLESVCLNMKWSDQAQGILRSIRRWNALEGAMD